MNIGNKLLSKTVDIDVLKPTVTADFKVGKVQIINNRLTLAKTDDKAKGGIDFNGKVEVPAGFAEGEWYFGQTVEPKSHVWNAAGEKYSYTKNGSPVKCDTTWPYSQSAPTPNPIETNDTPAITLKSDNRSKYQHGGSFQMYIMFKPAGTNSQFVPLKVLAWSFSGTATWDADTQSWGLSAATDPDPKTLQWADCSTHPTWKDNIVGGKYVLDP